MLKRKKSIIADIIDVIMVIIMFYLAIFQKETWCNPIWTLIFGIWLGWFQTRDY